MMASLGACPPFLPTLFTRPLYPLNDPMDHVTISEQGNSGY